MENMFDLLKRYQKADWFAKVGQPIKDETIARVDDWDTAIARSIAKYPGNWADTRLDALNIIGSEVQRHDRAQYQEWNHHVDSIKLQLGFLKEKVAKTPLEDYLYEVDYTVLGACMEAVYGGIIDTTVMRDMCEWFVKGHFPCGWEGTDYPRGKLIVY